MNERWGRFDDDGDLIVVAVGSAAGLTLKKVGERLATYLDAFLLEASKSAGKEFGKRLVQLSYWWALAATLMGLAQSVAALIPSAGKHIAAEKPGSGQGDQVRRHQGGISTTGRELRFRRCVRA
jgi:hypothetical protein